MFLTTCDNPHNTYVHEEIPDTAATKHYITEETLPICDQIQETLGM